MRLVNPDMHGTLVDLLFCDQNMYMLFASRCFVPESPWSRWSHFKGQTRYMPSFVLADACEEMTIKVSRNEFQDAWWRVHRSAEHIHVLADLASSTKRKVCEVIIMCVVTRILVLLHSTFGRLMDFRCTATGIAVILWMFMRSWKKLLKCALDNGRRVRARDAVDVDPKTVAVSYVSGCGINHVNEMIGPDGQLRLILLDGEDLELHI